MRVPDQALRYRPSNPSAAQLPKLADGSSPGLGAARWPAGRGIRRHRARRRQLHRDHERRPQARRPGDHRRASRRNRQPEPSTRFAAGLGRRHRNTDMADALIRVENVTRTYHVGDIDVHALRGVSLTIERGEFVAIMGSSGSGKSTLMSILGCLDRPTSGSYFFEGVDVARLDEPDLARIRSERLGFVFQSFNLLARTSAIENVALPLFYIASGPSRRGSRFERAREALRLLGLGEREQQHARPALRRPAATRRHRARADQCAERASWPTSRPAISIPAPRTRSWRRWSRSTASRASRSSW